MCSCEIDLCIGGRMHMLYLHDQKLEQIIVVTLKNKGMKRDHVCFRKCYNRLFNLSKSFLKV